MRNITVRRLRKMLRESLRDQFESEGVSPRYASRAAGVVLLKLYDAVYVDDAEDRLVGLDVADPDIVLVDLT